MSIRHDKEWSIDSWYNVDEPQKTLLSKGNQIQKSHAIQFLIYQIFRISKPINTKSISNC